MPYIVRSFKLDETKPTDDPELVDIAGDTITFYTSGSADGIQIAFDSPNGWRPITTLLDILPYPTKFERFYLSWSAQPGKYVQILVGPEGTPTK